MIKRFVFAGVCLLVLIGCQTTDQSADTPTDVPNVTEVAAATAEPTTPPTAVAEPLTATPLPATDVPPTDIVPTDVPTATALPADTPTEVLPTATPQQAAPTATQAATAPTIVDFSASHWTVGGGEPLVLSWEVTDATDVVLYLETDSGQSVLTGGAPVDSFAIDWTQGQYPLPPVQGSNNQYTLVANNNGERVSHSILITYDASLANSAEVAINRFDLSDTNILADGSINISWEVAQAARIDILTFTSDVNPELVLHTSADASGSHTLFFNDLPTYMFDSYGLSELPITLRAIGSDGTVVERSIPLHYSRPTVLNVLASPASLTAGQSLTISYNTTWAYVVELFIQRPDGEMFLDVFNAQIGQAGMPQSGSSNRVELTWETLTGNGAYTFDNGEITFILRASGVDNQATETITVPVQ